MKTTKLEDKLYRVLVKAKIHLEYCGYGDAWEREVAIEQKLEKDIEDAIKYYKEVLNDSTGVSKV